MIRCKRRGHKWRVAGWNYGGFVAQADHVHIECARCGQMIVAEVLSDHGNGSNDA